MNRLLFAAARGARFQWTDCSAARGVSVEELRRDPQWFQIEPDDEHLQYGPISTELRRYTEHGGWSYSDIGRVANALLLEWAPYPPVLESEWPHFQTLALLMAEHFADEGM